MKQWWIVLLFFVFLSFGAYTQHQKQYSLYMHDQGVFHPAFYDYYSDFSVTVLYRKQWVGMPLAPTSKSAIVSYNIGDKHGLRFQVYQDTYTIFQDMDFNLGYNYHVYTSSQSALSFGLSLSYGMSSANYAAANPLDPTDPAFSGSIAGKSYLNGAFGVWYETNTWYTGISAPHLLNNSLLTSSSGLFNFDIRYNHIYYTLGTRVGDSYLKMFPVMTAKLINGAPPSLDLNMNFLLRNTVSFGFGYRTDNSILTNIGYYILPNLQVVYGFDMPWLTSSYYNFGSHEIMLHFGTDFGKGNGKIKRIHLDSKGNFLKK